MTSLTDKWNKAIQERDEAVMDLGHPRIEQRIYLVEQDLALVMWFIDRLIKRLDGKEADNG